MTIAKLALMLVCLMSVTLEPKDAKVTRGCLVAVQGSR
jgi:hypothetical protein